MRSINRDIWSENVNFPVLLGGELPLPIQYGVKAWWDFPDASKFIEGDTDKIGQYLDSSGNGNTTVQLSGLDQPLYTKQINGLNVATFNGVSTSLLATIGINLDEHEVIIVLKMPTVLSDESDVIGTDIPAFGTGTILMQSATGNAKAIKTHYNPVSTFSSNEGATAETTDLMIIGQSAAGTELTPWFNGVADSAPVTIDAGRSSVLAKILIGTRYPGYTTHSLDADVGEVLVFDRELSVSDRADIYDNHLKPKWGI